MDTPQLAPKGQVSDYVFCDASTSEKSHMRDKSAQAISIFTEQLLRPINLMWLT